MDETHKLTSYLTPNAYRQLVDARKIISDIAKCYDETEGYIKIEDIPTAIRYRVKAKPTDYTIELRIETFEVIQNIN